MTHSHEILELPESVERELLARSYASQQDWFAALEKALKERGRPSRLVHPLKPTTAPPVQPSREAALVNSANPSLEMMSTGAAAL